MSYDVRLYLGIFGRLFASGVQTNCCCGCFEFVHLHVGNQLFRRLQICMQFGYSSYDTSIEDESASTTQTYTHTQRDRCAFGCAGGIIYIFVSKNWVSGSRSLKPWNSLNCRQSLWSTFHCRTSCCEGRALPSSCSGFGCLMAQLYRVHRKVSGAHSRNQWGVTSVNNG